MHDSLIAHLFSKKDEQKVFVVLDGASIPDLLDQLYGKDAPEFECLFRGELEPDVAESAPYLALLDRESSFASWVVREGWGAHWGIFAIAEADLRSMRTHFRKLLTYYSPEGKPMLFRYYDPRVLREYVQKCSPEELARVFGSVKSFVVEDADSKKALRFQYSSGSLKQETLSLT